MESLARDGPYLKRDVDVYECPPKFHFFRFAFDDGEKSYSDTLLRRLNCNKF